MVAVDLDGQITSGAIVSTLAIVFGLSRAWPQAARIVVRKDVAGVSTLSWRLTLCSGVSWIAIGIVNDIFPTIVFNVLAMFGVLTVLIAVARHERKSQLPTLSVIAGAAMVNAFVLQSLVHLATRSSVLPSESRCSFRRW